MGVLHCVDVVARELLLFAGVGLLIGGIDDLAVDLCFAAQRLLRPRHRLTLATLPPAVPLRFAVFVPAWEEAAVIGPMLDNLLLSFGTPHCAFDYRVYVGCYPNDPATMNAAQAVKDARVNVVIGRHAGPTTKADNLNMLWRALTDEAWMADAIVIHDAEDVVHAAELHVFAALLREHDVVQLPVLPIVDRGSRLLSGHYADEFAEMHARSLTVRTAVGAALPLAGTGCAMRISVLTTIARRRGGVPFDADSLTEDYELGLNLARQGARGCFARVREHAGGPLIAVRALFPGELRAAVRQKARWVTGIALAGWDRTGWAAPFALGDHWMRLRDRRAPLAMLVLAAAYLAMLTWVASGLLHGGGSAPVPPYPAALRTLLGVNTGLLVWRLAMRALFTGRAYGWREALWSVPRFAVGNAVALLAAPRAILLYARMLRGGAPVWDKTAHVFPDLAQAAAR